VRDAKLCAAIGCSERIPASKVMCAVHWDEVPDDLRRLIWRAYAPGQKLSRGNSDFVNAVIDAINVIARKQGIPEIDAANYFPKTVRLMVLRAESKIKGQSPTYY
jgi:hypothetical protein